MTELPKRYDGSDAKQPYPESEAVCPFCGEPGFDLIGLKHHLFQWCQVFDQTE